MNDNRSVACFGMMVVFLAPLLWSQGVKFKEVDYGDDKQRPIYGTTTQLVNTNTVLETTITNFLLNAWTSNAIIEVDLLMSAQTANGNNKNIMLKIGNTLVRKVTLSSGTQQTIMFNERIINRNDPQSQIGFPAANVGSYGGYGSSANALSTFAINGTITNTLFLTTSNQLATDSSSIEFLHVHIYPYP